ncbi:carbohydrate ABC transporter permease [Pectinatus frisingensis]|uniref:carbohydrate ABC transporter permease n=1 Tax=Pectinatus frisingensis TaxID=865 RepID=UPI0018C57CA2|nr:sugar ABC transporter permease [Pectinatus frisingensis]
MHWRFLNVFSGFKEAALYLIPSLSLFIVFIFYPLLKSIKLSIFNSDLVGRETTFAGFSYYSEMLSSSQFLHSLLVTLLFTFYTVVPGILIALFLACMVNSELKGIAIFRTIFAFPLSIAVAGASMIFMMLFNPSSGVFNYFLQLIHLPAVFWLSDAHWALLSVAIISIWRSVGFNTIVLLSGLQAIPEQIYESARIDGAVSWRQFIDITLPLLSPTLFFVCIVSVINALQTFGEINILTQGGPMEATNVIVYSIYREAFFNTNFGYASAESVVLFLLILICTLFEFCFLEKKVFYR